MQEIQDYAEAHGIKPATVLQKAAGLSGRTWEQWVSGKSSPTVRTVEKVRFFIQQEGAS